MRQGGSKKVLMFVACAVGGVVVPRLSAFEMKPLSFLH